MYPFYLEMELTKPVSDYFKEKGFKIRKEIKIGFFHADLVAFNSSTVIAVELKLKDWKKALIQAKNYQLGADFVYIAVPLMKSYNIIKKAQHIFEKEGIGLLIVNEKTCKVSEILKSKESKKKMGTLSIFDIDKNRKDKIFRY